MHVQWGAGCTAALDGAATLTPLGPVTGRTEFPRISHLAGRAGALAGSVVWRSQVWRAVLSCVGAGLLHEHFICSHAGITLIWTFWGWFWSPGVGTRWQVPVGTVPRVPALGRCVESGAAFHYLVLLSLSWLRVHTWASELTFLRGIPGAGLYLS